MNYKNLFFMVLIAECNASSMEIPNDLEPLFGFEELTPKTLLPTNPSQAIQSMKSNIPLASSDTNLSNAEIILNQARFFCDQCDKSYKNKSSLKNHILWHAYSCLICDQSFKTQEKLDIHIPKHTKEKIYICLTCRKHFSSMSNRNAHIRKFHLSYTPAPKLDKQKDSGNLIWHQDNPSEKLNNATNLFQ